MVVTPGVQVLLQHRGGPSQQVPAQLLRFQVPSVSHVVSHGCVHRPELHGVLIRRGTKAECEVKKAVLQNIGARHSVLWVRCMRKHFPSLSTRLIQPGSRRNDPLFHRHILCYYARYAFRSLFSRAAFLEAFSALFPPPKPICHPQNLNDRENITCVITITSWKRLAN
eukprot:5731183-Pyramimonas_sp.AAC.1